MNKKELFSTIESQEVFHQDASVVLKPCAICGGRSGKRLYMQAHFPVIACQECSLVYADEHFKETDLAEFYSGDYYQRAYICHPPEIDKKIADDYVKAFERVDRLHAGGRLLDFGSARGTFIKELRSRGYSDRWEFEGLDINPDEVDMGRADGLQITCGTLDTAAYDPARFDMVTSFSVLEHLQEPLQELRKLHGIVKPGGHLLAIIPAGNCLILKLAVLASRVLGERAREFTDNVFHEEHLYYFSRTTLRRALRDCGFEVEAFFGLPSYLETHPPGFLVAVAATGLRVASWALRMQTMLGVVARRVEG
jgi:2-polyprenyl-3-methyl-5-hydroxy-6-metoxy-1,4-benzoquinol methylase